MASPISGIYRIQQVGTDRIYIGSSTNISVRLRKHEGDLRLGKHHSRFLQRVYDRHGLGALSFWIVERCDAGELIAREQAYLDALKPAFNVAKFADAPTRGTRLTPEHIEKVRKASTGRRHTDEAKKKISVAHTGRVHTAETREKNRAGQLGKTLSASHRRKIALAHLGAKRPPETCMAIAAALAGKKRPGMNSAAGNAKRTAWRASLAPEQTEAMRAKKSASLKAMHAARSPEKQREIGRKNSEAQRGKVIPQEVRAKIAAALAGRVTGTPSAETRQKISDALRRRFSKISQGVGISV